MKKLRKNDPVKKSQGQKRQESVFAEAWENMSEDMGKFMPGFLVKKGKGQLWVVVVVTLVELVVLGAVGKFVYDWFVG